MVYCNITYEQFVMANIQPCEADLPESIAWLKHFNPAKEAVQDLEDEEAEGDKPDFASKSHLPESEGNEGFELSGCEIDREMGRIRLRLKPTPNSGPKADARKTAARFCC